MPIENYFRFAYCDHSIYFLYASIEFVRLLKYFITYIFKCTESLRSSFYFFKKLFLECKFWMCDKYQCGQKMQLQDIFFNFAISVIFLEIQAGKEIFEIY